MLLSPMAFADGAKEGGTATPAQTTEQSASTKDADKAKVGNPEIEKLLHEGGVKFSYTENGYFRIDSWMVGDRSQLVFIDPVVDTVRDYKVFRIYSVAYRGRLTKPMIMELVQKRHKVGFWRIEKIEDTEDTFYVVFFAQLPSTISAKDLRSCIITVAQEADTLESEWTDVDER